MLMLVMTRELNDAIVIHINDSDRRYRVSIIMIGDKHAEFIIDGPAGSSFVLLDIECEHELEEGLSINLLRIEKGGRARVLIAANSPTQVAASEKTHEPFTIGIARDSSTN